MSVAWADEVFVVDSYSTDGTVRVATEHGAQVVQFDYRPGGPRKKNWSLDNLSLANEWVLFLDADERITPHLRKRSVTCSKQDRNALDIT